MRTQLPRSDASQRWLLPAAWLLVIGTHALALLTFGATFWIDSHDYAALGEAMSRAEGLSVYYATTGRWIFSHLQPGVPVIWVLLKVLPEGWRWPSLAVAQHALAAASLLYTFHTIQRIWPSRLHLVALAAICLLPQCQAFHGALLTESITSSLLLVAFTACVSLCLEPPPHGRHILLVLTAMIAVTQFRSYWGMAVAGMLMLSLLRTRMLLPWLGPIVAIAGLVSVLAFPAYRWMRTGEFFLPQGGMNLLVSGLNVDVQPCPDAVSALESLPWPPGFGARQALEKGLDAYQCMDIGDHWRSIGMDNRTINANAERVGTMLRNDGPAVQIRRASYGLCSVGSIGAMAFGDPRQDVMRGMGLRRMLSHQMHYYRWHGWIDRGGYEGSFEAFFGPASRAVDVPFQQQAKASIYAAWKPYLAKGSTLLRDPLFIGCLPPDVWLAFAIVGCCTLARRIPIVPMLVTILVLTGFLTAAWFPLGNTRYANPLLAIYLMTASIAMATRWPDGPADSTHAPIA